MSKDTLRLRNFVKHFVNPFMCNIARFSPGPFALLRHVGRRSGNRYEIPMMVWRVDDGFVIVLTYGTAVDWLRNLQATGQGTLRWHHQEYAFQKPELLDAKTALLALPPVLQYVFRLRHTQDFVRLLAQRVA